MEALEVLKGLVAKYNDLKQADENYRTWRDTALADCFKEAQAFLANQEPKAEVKEVVQEPVESETPNAQ